MSYTVVIPTYHNFDGISVLLSNIATITKKHKPTSIIIVNDGQDEQTQYAGEILSSELLPPIQVMNIPHSGPLVAMQTGLDAVKTEYAIVIHDDTRLTNHITIHGHEFIDIVQGRKIRFRIETGQQNGKIVQFFMEDPLSLLYNHIIDPYSQESKVGMVSCCALNAQSPYFIQGGYRALGRNNFPFTPCKQSKFEKLWLYGQFVGPERWKPVHSIDTHIFIIQIEAYRQVGFNPNYHPYLFGFDDFCARFRQTGYKIYFTTDTVVYHPKTSMNIEGKLSKPTPEQMKHAIGQFMEDWKNSDMWKIDAIEEVNTIQEISPDTMEI